MRDTFTEVSLIIPSLKLLYSNLSLTFFCLSLILLSNFHYLISDLYISPFRSTLRRIYFTIHYHANNPIIACFTTIIVVSLKDVIHHTTRVNRPVHPGTQIRSRRCNDWFTRVER